MEIENCYNINIIWTNAFLYCMEKEIDFKKLCQRCFIDIQEAMEKEKRRFFNFGGTKDGKVCFSTINFELMYLSKSLKVSFEKLVETSQLEQRMLKFLESLPYASFDIYNSDGRLEWRADAVCLQFTKEYDMFAPTINICKSLDTYSFSFEYSVYIDFGFELNNYRDRDNQFLNYSPFGSFWNRGFGLWEGNSGIVADWIEDESSVACKAEYEILDFKNVIVKSSIRKCSSETHKMFLINGIVFILNAKTHEIEHKIVPVMYCKECDAYFIYEYDYQALLMKGRPLCRVLSYDKWEKKSFDSFSGLSDKSVFNLCGYNVNAQEDLSDNERQKILDFMIQRDIVSIQQTMNYLTWLIRSAKNRNGLQNAVHKWDKDYEYIKSKYKTDSCIVVSEFVK